MFICFPLNNQFSQERLIKELVSKNPEDRPTPAQAIARLNTGEEEIFEEVEVEADVKRLFSAAESDSENQGGIMRLFNQPQLFEGARSQQVNERWRPAHINEGRRPVQRNLLAEFLNEPAQVNEGRRQVQRNSLAEMFASNEDEPSR